MMKAKIKKLKEKLLKNGYCLAGDDNNFTAMNFLTSTAYSFKVMPDRTVDIKKLNMKEVK